MGTARDVPEGHNECVSDPRPLAARYDQLASMYDEFRDLFDVGEVLAGLRAHLPAPGSLLDLGCGAGHPVAAAFIDSGWEVTGVDFSRGMLDLATVHAPQMIQVHADMREVDFPADSFDAITSIYSLFHIPWNEHPALFERMHRWLRPGGYLLFTYATAAYTGHEEVHGEKEFLGTTLFYSHTTPDNLYAQLREAGFEVVEGAERTITGETFLWVTAQAS